jgi:hypothetical protein
MNKKNHFNYTYENHFVLNTFIHVALCKICHYCYISCYILSLFISPPLPLTQSAISRLYIHADTYTHNGSGIKILTFSRFISLENIRNFGVKLTAINKPYHNPLKWSLLQYTHKKIILLLFKIYKRISIVFVNYL